METLTCSGSFCLSLLLCALVSFWRDLMKNKASREGRGCAHRALLLLSPLLLFSSFSFGSSSISGYYAQGGVCTTLASSCASQFIGAYTYGYVCGSICCFPNSTYTFTPTPCSATCTVPSGTPVGEIGNSLTPNSNGVLPGTFCNPSTNCDTQSYGSSAGSGGSMTNGQACFVSAPTASTTSSSSSSSCPAGYSVSDASGCVCSNGSGSFVPSNNSDINPSCNGGTSTAPTLSPVSPVTSNGTTSCPSGPGTAQITNGSSTSCYQVVVPPPTNLVSTPSPGGGGGGGGGSTYHLSAPTVSSNGQLTCPPGASTIGSGPSLECIVSGPPGSGGSPTSPTASGSSGTSPTASASSAPQYPTSFSMPTMGTSSVSVLALGQIASANESTSQSCPSPVTFNVMNHTFSISFTYACQLAAMVRPVVIGVFSMASLLLIVK